MAKKSITCAPAQTETKAQPATFAEAVAQELASWGDSWQEKRPPLPRVCIEWKIAAEDFLRPVLAFGPEAHAKSIRRRAAAGSITAAQAESKKQRGDEVRGLVADWGGRWQSAIARRDRLALLVALKFLPRPNSSIVREWLGLSASSARPPIDHEQRMRDAVGVFDSAES